jgi:hypothetical protein
MHWWFQVCPFSQCLSTPAIGIFAIFIAWLQYDNNRKKRKNDLFDKRYEFYQRFRNWWLAAAGSETVSTDIETLIPIAEEAFFLFGNDISQHILSLEGEIHTGSPFFPNSDFSKPFEKHLKLQ